MINKITGLPVSKEMEDTLKKLSRNEFVNMNIIQNLPEIVTAKTCVNHAIQTSDLKGREDIQKGILMRLEKRGSVQVDTTGQISYNGEVKRDGRIDIVIGLPGSGKSSTLVNPISEKYGSRIIDSDEAKQMIPEYNNGWGAGTVHTESKLINQQLLREALIKHENIVYPVVGSKPERLMEIISRCEKVDYKIYLHYVEIPNRVAMGRMINRFLEEGRFIDPQIVADYENKVEKSFNEIMKGDVVDGATKWNNSGERGTSAELIQEFGGCNGFGADLSNDRGRRGTGSKITMRMDRPTGLGCHSEEQGKQSILNKLNQNKKVVENHNQGKEKSIVEKEASR